MHQRHADAARCDRRDIPAVAPPVTVREQTWTNV